MSDTVSDDDAPTFEEASRCPKCDKPGREVTAKPGQRRGVVVHVIECVTELCRWHGERWFVQVNEDGTIPRPYSQVGPKAYPKVSDESISRINEALERQLNVEKGQGGEIRNPYS